MKPLIKTTCVLFLIFAAININFLFGQTCSPVTNGTDCVLKSDFCVVEDIAVGVIGVSGASASQSYYQSLLPYFQITSVDLVSGSGARTSLSGFTMVLVNCGGGGSSTGVVPFAYDFNGNIISANHLFSIKGVVPSSAAANAGYTIETTCTFTDPNNGSQTTFSRVSCPFSIASSLPGQPGLIVGTPGVCQGQNGVPYSVSPIANIIGYSWFVPNGGTIASGDGTNSITVNFSTEFSGLDQIGVQAINGCGNGAIRSKSITIAPLPSPAGTISGSPMVCQGQTNIPYSVPAIPDATGYVWTLPSGATIATGANTNSITVNFSASATSGNITVQGVNSCGAGTSSSKSITVTPSPGSAGTISGSSAVYQGQTGVSYSVPPIANATSYNWTLPSGATIATGANTNSITVNFSASAVAGTITVQGINSCGNGTSSSLAITLPCPTYYSGVYPSAYPTYLYQGQGVWLQTWIDDNSQAYADNVVFKWYSGSCGGTYLGDMSVYVTPAVTTTYYLQAEGCGTASCESITITVDPCYYDVPNNLNKSSSIQLTAPATQAYVTTSASLKWNVLSFPSCTNNAYTYHVKIAPEITDPITGLTKPDWANAVGFSTTSQYDYLWYNRSVPISTYLSAKAYDQTYYWRVAVQCQSQPITWSEERKFILQRTTVNSPSEAYLLGASHTNNINWVYGASFLDNNKVSEGIAYLDGLGKTRQVQSKLNSENKIMCVEAAYSEEGGGASMTLPAPLSVSTFGYAHRFFDVLNGTNKKDFSTEDFDREIKAALGNTLMTPTGIDPTSDLGMYYGNANTDSYVDDAEGYPYSYNVGYQSPLQRPMLTAGGVGSTFKITGGKEYRHFYGKPSQEELNRVYGAAAAPKDTNINRTVTYDPNGVGYITYKDNEGKVIATALTVCNAPSLKPLVEDGMTPFGVQVNPLGNSRIDATSLVNGAGSKFFIPCDGTPTTINYALDLTHFTVAGMPCQTCQYDVNVKIVNENTGKVVLDQSNTLIPSSAVCSGTPERVNVLTNTVLTLEGPAGYIINRTIQPHTDTVTGNTSFTDAVNNYSTYLNTKVDSLKAVFSEQYYTRSDFYLLRRESTQANAAPYIAPQNCYDVSWFAGSGDQCNDDGYLSVADFMNPRGITRDPFGNFYIANAGLNSIRKINTDGTVYTFAGNDCAAGALMDGAGANARLNKPYDVVYAADPLHPFAGKIYVADRDNNAIRAISMDNASVTTLAVNINGISLPEGLGSDAAGNVYVASTGNNRIYKIDLQGTITQIASAYTFNQPSDVAVDKNGIIYVTEKAGNVVKKIDINGVVTVFAGSGSSGSADGVGTAASFYAPGSVSIDKDGRLYVSDGGNNTLRLIDVNGSVTTLAGTAAAGGMVNGQGSAARFNAPAGLYTDPSGNSYLADEFNHLIRRINRVKCATEADPCLGNNCKTYRSYVDKITINDVTQAGYTKHLVDLDGDANNDNVPVDENYLANSITYTGDLNSSSPVWTDFVATYQRMHKTSPAITKMEQYAVTSDVLNATSLSSINDNKTLNTSDLQPYYLLKVIFTKEACLCTPDDYLPTDCAQQCDEQKQAYQAEADAAYAKLSVSTTIYKPSACLFCSGFTLQQLEDSYYPLNADWVGKLNDDDFKLFTEYETKRAASEKFSVSDCMSLCSDPPSICETCQPAYSSCVFENMDELTNGRKYLLEKWDANGGVFPYTLNTSLKLNGIPNSDELGGLGLNLLNFLYTNFGNSYITTRDNWDLQGGACATCQAPAHASPACSALADRDVSQFFTMFLIPVGSNSSSLLDMANAKCQAEYEACFSLNGSVADQQAYFCLQNKNNCIAALDPASPTYSADLASCNAEYTNCNAATYSTATEQYRGLKVRELLNHLYPGNNRAVDSVAAIVLPVVANKTLAELEEYLFYFEFQHQCEMNCSNAFNNAFNQWLSDKIATAATALRSNYISQCNGNINEVLNITYNQSFYHYTLYNYDYGNNLKSTVPPEGVDYIDLQTTPNRVPDHRMQSTYTSTSLYTTSASSPDEGTTLYLYDKAGRVRFSQTAEQRARSVTQYGAGNDYKIFSYTKYDNNERVIEAGEFKDEGGIICSWNCVDITCACSPGLISVGAKVNDLQWPYYANSTFEETYMAYDTPSLPSFFQGGVGGGYTQTHLQGRVSQTYNSEGATHYSYDAHGRVKFAVQEINALNAAPSPLGGAGGGFKTIDYIYTTLTSRVDQIIYQKGVPQEEFRTRYSYDIDDRLIKTETSRDGGLTWLNAAGYSYYTHGPLKTKSLGDNIQEVDMTYTINGWLKAINNPISNGQLANEQNEGGVYITNFGKDVFSETLNYYRGDFKRGGVGFDASNINNVPEAGTALSANWKDLYNGNIGNILTNTAFNLTDGTLPNILAQSFTYDYLNRLTDVYAETQAENFTAFKASGTGTDEYGIHLTYDANGNILTFVRNSMNAGITMDNMTYNYPDNNGAGKKTSNKLGHIDDTGANLTDIADIIDQGSGNYTYDAKGRIVSDLASDIQTIEWTAYDKVKKITHTTASAKGTVEFTYNSKQQRQTKKVVTASLNISTIYSYDASGILVATYQYDNSNNQYRLLDHEVYGLSRIGSYRVDEALTASSINTVPANHVARQRFELTDHLGSVRAVVSGNKINGGTLLYEEDFTGASCTTCSDCAGWSTCGNLYASLVTNAGNTALSVYASDDGGMTKVFTTVPGKSYNFTFDAAQIINMDENTDVNMYIIDPVSPYPYTTLAQGYITTPGSKSYSFTATSNKTQIRFYIDEATTLVIDNMQIQLINKPVPFNNAPDENFPDNFTGTTPASEGWAASVSGGAQQPTLSNSNNRLQLTGVNFSMATKNVNTIPGSIYELSFDLTKESAAAVVCGVLDYESDFVVVKQVTLSSNVTNYTLHFKASSVYSKLFFQLSTSATGTIYLDNINVQELIAEPITNIPPCTSLSFDGSNDYVNIPHHNAYDIGTGNFTIETWIKANSVQPGYYPILFSNYDYITTGQGIYIYMDAGSGTINAGTTYNGVGSSTNVADNTWHHIALVKAGTILSLYIDGVLAQNSDSGWPAEDNTSTLGIKLGQDVDLGGDYFKGSIYDTRFWNVARTPAEINSYKNKLPTGAETGLTGLWPMNEGTGTIANDLSALNNDGTLLNAPTWQTTAGCGYNLVEIISLSDYDAFGMTLQGRSFVGENNRFGYQGSERDQEVLGGNEYTTEYRMLDVRVGRWFSTDPMIDPSVSPYVSMDNNPVALTDVMGLSTGSGATNPGIASCNPPGGGGGASSMTNTSGTYVSSDAFTGGNTSNSIIQQSPSSSGALQQPIPMNRTPEGLKILPAPTLKTKLNQSIDIQQDELSTFDKVLIDFLVKFAKRYIPNVESLSEREKQALFRKSGTKSAAVLLYEFATGTGEEKRVFNEQHDDAIAKEMKEKIGEEIMKKLNKRMEEKGITFDEFEYDEFGYEFSPDDASLLESAEKHLDAIKDMTDGDILPMVLGGMSVQVRKVGVNEVQIKLINKHGKRSLKAHRDKDTPRNKNKKTPLGDIWQTIIFYFTQ